MFQVKGKRSSIMSVLAFGLALIIIVGGVTPTRVSAVDPGIQRNMIQVVAASDTLAKFKDDVEAAFLCDGADDEDTIGAALAQAHYVVLLPGTYNLDDPLSIPSDSWLTGYTVGQAAGGGGGGGGHPALTILKVTTDDHDAIVNSGGASGNSNVRLSNIKIDGDKANRGGYKRGIAFTKVSNYLLENIYVTNCSGTGVSLFNDSSRGKVVNSSFIANGESSSGGHGLHINGSDYVVVENSLFEDNYTNGVRIESTSTRTAKHNTIANSVAIDNGGAGFSAQGDYNEETDTCDYWAFRPLITGNQAYINDLEGINLKCANHALLSSNILTQNNEGIVVDNSLGAVISANDSYYNGGPGIAVRDSSQVSIVGNFAKDNNQLDSPHYAGIVVYAYEHNIDHIQITGNQSGGATQASAIKLVAASGKTLTHGIVADNHLYSSDGPNNDRPLLWITGDGTIASSMKVWDNTGWLTENNGSDTIANGSRVVTVTHSLGDSNGKATPTIVDVTFTEDPTTDPSFWWISNVGDTTFTLNVCCAHPGATGLDFYWEAKVR